ncbi:hypothetical protein ABEB33_22310 [Herbaspirillum huttiense]|uniref:hypothetical protein n=1 Tax=Herbaspirillum huttiense TaxID=863372 RepID=UPI003877D3F4
MAYSFLKGGDACIVLAHLGGPLTWITGKVCGQEADRIFRITTMPPAFEDKSPPDPPIEKSRP